MRNRKATQPTLLVKNIQTYIDAINDKYNLHYVIKPEGDYYLVDGILLKASLVDRSLPSIVLQKATLDKGMRLDSRSNWID